MSGGYNPSPMQFGAEMNKIIELIQQGVEQAQGTALATEYGTIAWVENHATARVLADLAKSAIRLGNQWDPEKMTDFIPRWEKILGIIPSSDSTDNERRAEIGLKLSLTGEPPTYQVVYDFLSDLLGEVFVNLILTTSVEASGMVPGGITIPGGVTLSDGDWISSIAYLAIEVEKPMDMTYKEFYPLVGKIYQYLNVLLPAWCDFDWFLDGVNGAGFYLDEERNLDNMRFD